MEINKKFHSGNNHPIVKNVEELIEQLKQLPGELPLTHNEFLGLEVIVYNFAYDNPHVGLNETTLKED